MIDMHTHVIPFVDDGSKSIEDSIDMIKQEINQGIDTIICTPHYIHRRYEKCVDEIKKNYNLLLDKAKELNLNVNLLLGQEICYTHRVNIIEMLKKKELLTLNDTQYVLLEFSYHHEPEDIYDIIYNFRVNGYKVVVAHVERYEWITVDKVKGLISEGAIIQINSGSVVGSNSIKEKRFVKKLLRLNLVDIVASDIHSFRPSTMQEALKKVKNEKLFNFNF